MLSTGISVAHSNDTIARTLQEPSSRLVVASLRFSIVHVPLELDHNPFTGAIEIHNKAVHYVLSPKLEPEDSAVAQQRPGVTLSWRRVVAQLAGANRSAALRRRSGSICPSVPHSGTIYATKTLPSGAKGNSPFVPPLPEGEGGQGVRTRLLDKVVPHYVIDAPGGVMVG